MASQCAVQPRPVSSMHSPFHVPLELAWPTPAESSHPEVDSALAVLRGFHDSAERQIDELTRRGRVESPPFPLPSESDAWYATLGWLERMRRIWAAAVQEVAAGAKDRSGRTLAALYHEYCRRAQSEPRPSQYGWETAAEYVRSCACALRETAYVDPRDLAPLP